MAHESAATPDPAPRPGAVPADLYRPFRSRRGRMVAAVIGIAQFLMLLWLAIWLPEPYTYLDKSELVVIGVAVGAILWRLGQVRAMPSASGLVVHNLIRTTTLEWAQIVAVRLGGGGPWVMLDLADGDTLAVMAIQRADGESGEAEAKRLATLVALGSRTARDD
ncbi:MAG: PH domain-containing protein [Kineosporiaceae bacterium]